MNNIISIIVPVYKVEKYLKRCIDSVLSQSYSNWEMILVDDGSPDKCPVICDEFSKWDSRIKVIHKINEGQAIARNVGLDIAKGDYVLFLDSDDYIHSDTLKDMLKIAMDQDADIVQCSFIRGALNEFPPITKVQKVQVFDNRSIFYSRVQKIIVWGKLYRKYLWNGVRMPGGKLNYEDDATTWKLYYRSKRIAFVNTPYFYYFENSTSTMAIHSKSVSLSFIKAYEERIDFFQNEGDKLLVDISKWRFCLPLMLNYMKGNVKKEDLPVLLKLFYLHNKSAMLCNKVFWWHRALISLFGCCPTVFRKFFEIIGKAHTL